MGEQAVREGEVDMIKTTSAVLLGQEIRSLLRNKVTSVGQNKVNDAQKSARKANRLAKNAKNKSTRSGKIEARQKAANKAQKEALNVEKRNQLKGLAAGASAAGTARKTVEEMRKDEN